jgi:hypothetical protein
MMMTCVKKNMNHKYKIFLKIFFVAYSCAFCGQVGAQNKFINPSGTSISTRFLPPQGFQRTKTAENSYANYLQNLPLKPHGSSVLFYNGEEKTEAEVYCAVVAMEIGNRDLQQCADAIMRLRAEYLFQQQQYEQIHFNFTSGDRADYTKYAEGYRAIVKNNKVSWQKTGKTDYSYSNFRKYMDLVFTYAGTLSLNKELKQVPDIQNIKIGDVFIQGGSPGHAVVVIDVAENPKTKEKLFLLAQSYMPAQETQVLVNPSDAQLSPWYSIKFGTQLETPEWTFEKKNLKRFEGE